jgi:DNA polymerase-3 subunit delta'
VGHVRQLERLEREIQEQNLSHAYLFHGMADIGKFRLARTMASILQCPNGYCQHCPDCRQIKAGIHPDVIIMKDIGETLKIDDIRTLVQKTNLTSYSKRRFVVIENIERMPMEAQNAFLKTLEEPAGDTIFLLTVTQMGEVLETIQSRTRQMAFFNVADDVIRKALIERFGFLGHLDEVIQIAQGRPGLAIRLLESDSLLMDYRKMYNRIDLFFSDNALSEKFRFVEELDSAPDQIPFFFDTSFRYLRYLLHEGASEQKKSGRFDLADIFNLFESLTKTRYLVDRNINKKLALENFFLQTER